MRKRRSRPNLWRKAKLVKPVPLRPVTIDLSTSEKRAIWNTAVQAYAEALIQDSQAILKRMQEDGWTKTSEEAHQEEVWTKQGSNEVIRLIRRNGAVYIIREGPQ